MVTLDIFGISMLKPSTQGGEHWIMNNNDFNNDPQVYTYSLTEEYGVTSEQDDAGVRWTLSTSTEFYSLISSSRGLDPTNCTLDQGLMVQRGYMQTPSDWKNVEFTGNFKVITEGSDGIIRIGFRGALHKTKGPPSGCVGSNYVVEIPLVSGGIISLRKESYHSNFTNWLTTQVSGFDSTVSLCGFTIKVLCYNTQDNKGVTVEVWLDRDNDNEFELVLQGTDYGQINKDASACGCASAGQPLIWGSPTVLLQQVGTGKFGWKNVSIREIDPYGTGTSGGTPPALDTDLVIYPPAVTNNFVYKNGDLWSGAEVHFIFWGNDWSSRRKPYGKTDIEITFNFLFYRTAYFDYLIEHNIKRPILGWYAINSTLKLPSNYSLTQQDIENCVKDSIAKGIVPANTKLTDRNLYFVIPAFYYKNIDSTSGHSYYPYPQDDTKPRIVYAWANIFYNNNGYLNNQNDLSYTITRQLVNALSDPVPGTGIIASQTYVQSLNASPQQQNTIIELADACIYYPSPSYYIHVTQPYSFYINVSKYYSDALGECAQPALGNVPFMGCSSKSLEYDYTTQTCKPVPEALPPSTGPGQLPPVTIVYGVGIVDAGGSLTGVEYQVGYRVNNFTASSYDANNIPNNVGDGYKETRWSAFDIGQWIKADLGSNKNVTSIKVAWYRGEVRTNDFEIYTSTDDQTYTLQYVGSSTKGSSALEEYIINATPISCRYVALVNLGNDESVWCSITEIQIWGPDVPPNPAGGSTLPGSGAPAPPLDASYNFIDTSFAVDFVETGGCNPLGE